ncbi:MAG: hypothetical protein IK139_00760 [Lachnospiraceae bacterium]|nr:hypothetical protein [Lachnospiraceae bacterium]
MIDHEKEEKSMSEMEKNIISDDEVEEATGGMLLDTRGTEFYDPDFPYAAVNNNTGQIMGKFVTPQAAEDYANSFGKDNAYNAMWVDVATVRRLQANPNTCPQ